MFSSKPVFKFLPAVSYVKLSRVTIPGKQVCFPCRDIIIIVVVIIITSPSLLSVQKTSRVIIAALRYHFRPQVRAHPRNISRLLVLPSQSIPPFHSYSRFQDDSLLDDSSASSHFGLEHETIRRRQWARAAKLLASRIRETNFILTDSCSSVGVRFFFFSISSSIVSPQDWLFSSRCLISFSSLIFPIERVPAERMLIDEHLRMNDSAIYYYCISIVSNLDLPYREKWIDALSVDRPRGR